MIKIGSPLEQFTIFNILKLEQLIENIVTNFSLNSIIAYLFLIILIINFNYLFLKFINKDLIVDKITIFLKNLFLENIKLKKPYFFSNIVYIFLTILLLNTLGLIPFCFTTTSSIIVTFSISLGCFVNIIFTGIKLHKFKFFNLFLPSGAPFAIIPFLIIIEFISFNARIFSLAIRLFANMMSGHILLKIIAIAILKLFIILFPLSIIYLLIPITLVNIIILLEFSIAFLQAYVFVTLLCIYFNESINLH